MSVKRIERGWIYVDGKRLDNGEFQLGSGDELKFSPADALQEREAAAIPMRAILKASVQRLAFWRR